VSEVNFSPPCSAAVKNEWSYFSAPFMYVNGVDREHITLLLSDKRRTQDKGKGKKVNKSHYRPGQAPEGSRSLRLPDFKTVGT